MSDDKKKRKQAKTYLTEKDDGSLERMIASGNTSSKADSLKNSMRNGIKHYLEAQFTTYESHKEANQAIREFEEKNKERGIKTYKMVSKKIGNNCLVKCEEL